jgi:DNA-binding HxlR family transcriptional regulator
MRLYDYEIPDDACARIGSGLGHLGSKWALPVIMRLGDGPVRFNELKRRVPGISQKVLTTTLRSLERSGYVRRTEVARVPPQVDYDLTPQCRALLLPMRDLIRAAVDQQPAVEAAQRAFDAKNKR